MARSAPPSSYGFGDFEEGTVGHESAHLDHDAVDSYQKWSKGPKGEEHPQLDEHAANIVGSIMAATDEERRAGSRFYDRAHVDAYNVGHGLNPRPGGEELHKKLMAEADKTDFSVSARGAAAKVRATYTPDEKRLTEKGAGMIAALSPASPAGMTWDKNPGAAHDMQRLQPSVVDHLQAAKDLQTQSMTGEAKRSGTTVRLRAQAQEVSSAARSQLPGDLKLAGGHAILKAWSMAQGADPEDVMDKRRKTGNFYENIAHPDNPDAVTVDYRSHDITAGVRLPFAHPEHGRLSSNLSMYEHFSQAHRVAAQATGFDRAHEAQATSWIHDKNAHEAAASAGHQKIGRGNARKGERTDRV